MKKYNSETKKFACIESIPQGIYCCDSEGLCPYWSIQENKPTRRNGYCYFLQKGDWELYHGLIWKQHKECNIFTEVNKFALGEINIMKMFWRRLLLWNTISKTISFRKKLYLLFHGKICLCKFCRKYFITSQEATNETSCGSCWMRKMQNRKHNSRSFNKIVDQMRKKELGHNE